MLQFAGKTGAVVGGGVGNYMDRQAAALKKNLPEAEVFRDGDKVYVALPSGSTERYRGESHSEPSCAA